MICGMFDLWLDIMICTCGMIWYSGYFSEILVGLMGSICQISCINSYFRPVSTLSILTIFLYICSYVRVGVAGVGGRIRLLTAAGHMCWWQGLCLCIACVYFVSWIWSCCIDMRVMGYTMYVFKLMYLWIPGLRCMYDDGLEPYAVWSMMYACVCLVVLYLP